MGSSEFDLIRKYFVASRRAHRRDVLVGVGDDAAVLQARDGSALALSMDTLVAGVHFAPDAEPDAVGHKALAASLSDMAAMGAEPAWAVLGLTLPVADDSWVAGFCRGFFALAAEYGVALVGGDTTRGPLSVTVTVQGFLPAGCGFRRAAARPGHLICVTGTLGDAGLALHLARQGHDDTTADMTYLNDRLQRPRPRVREAQRLHGLAQAAIDVSDGLIADLGHILDASDVGATLTVDSIPLSPAFRSCAGDTRSLDLALTAGDDYELCFTVPSDVRSDLDRAMAEAACPFTPIGTIDAEPGLRLVRDDGAAYEVRGTGYDHFSTS